MPWTREGSIIGPTQPGTNYLPLDPHTKERYPYPADFIIRGKEELDMAEAASLGAKQRGERGQEERQPVDVIEVLAMRKQVERIWGRDMAEYFQQFNFPKL